MSAQTGRPTVMTEAIVQKLEQALRDGFTVEMACYVSGVSRSTFYSHLTSDEDFSDKMTLAQEWTTQRAKQVVSQAIDAGDVKTAQWWLERKQRQEFSPNQSPVKQQGEDDYIDRYFDGDPQKYAEFLERAATALRAG